MGGIIDHALETLIRNYEVAGSMGGGGTEPLMPNAGSCRMEERNKAALTAGFHK